MGQSLLCLFVALHVQAQQALPTLNIDASAITISGVSSGAFMATQMEVAFSKTFSGAGAIAGGIYWCAEGNATRAETTCMTSPTAINPQDQITEAKTLAAAGSIDPLNNLARHHVYIYASPKDIVINSGNSDKLEQFLEAFLPAANVVSINSVPSGHGWPTLNSGTDCSASAPPWILNCNYDAAGAILQEMYSSVLNPRSTMVSTHLLQFSQAPYGGAQTPLYPTGWIYVPTTCADGATCRLHIILHGCEMNPDFIQDQLVNEAGFNEWAESNNIVVLYPQSAKLDTLNPEACWDWYGFTGANYMTQSGTQMAALKSMIDHVSGH